MIRPERDPHWCLGVEHGRDAVDWYQFADAENQRRYLAGYEVGQLARADRVPTGTLPTLEQQMRALGGQSVGVAQGPRRP